MQNNNIWAFFRCFFFNFDFPDCQVGLGGVGGQFGGGRVKGQKVVQNDTKFCLSRSLSQEPYIIWFDFQSFMVHMCKMISSDIFLSFKNYDNGKNFNLPCSISQEPYIMWSLFVAHKCKMTVSPGVFFIFWNFEFSGW